MAKLVNVKTGAEHELRTDRRFTLVGRSDETDICIDTDLYVSRFHSTIFKHEDERNPLNSGYFLIDHSLNRTYYPVFKAGPVSEDSLLQTAFRSSTASNGGVTQYGYKDLVTVMRGYVPHEFETVSDMNGLIEMIKNDLERPKLIKEQDGGVKGRGVARRLTHGNILAITSDPKGDYRYRFLEV